MRPLYGPIKWSDRDAECIACAGIITRGDQVQMMVEGPLNVVVGPQHAFHETVRLMDDVRDRTRDDPPDLAGELDGLRG